MVNRRIYHSEMEDILSNMGTIYTYIIYILYNQLISADVEAIIYTGRAANKMAYDLRIDTSSIHSSKPGYKATWNL